MSEYSNIYICILELLYAYISRSLVSLNARFFIWLPLIVLAAQLLFCNIMTFQWCEGILTLYFGVKVYMHYIVVWRYTYTILWFEGIHTLYCGVNVYIHYIVVWRYTCTILCTSLWYSYRFIVFIRYRWWGN